MLVLFIDSHGVVEMMRRRRPKLRKARRCFEKRNNRVVNKIMAQTALFAPGEGSKHSAFAPVADGVGAWWLSTTEGLGRWCVCRSDAFLCGRLSHRHCVSLRSAESLTPGSRECPVR
jgi:hypothetical protein